MPAGARQCDGITQLGHRCLVHSQHSHANAGPLRRGAVKKHVAAIHVSGKLTLLQRKLSNVLQKVIDALIFVESLSPKFIWAFDSYSAALHIRHMCYSVHA